MGGGGWGRGLQQHLESVGVGAMISESRAETYQGNEFLQVFRRRTLVAFVRQGHGFVINSLCHWRPVQFFHDRSNVFSLPCANDRPCSCVLD